LQALEFAPAVLPLGIVHDEDAIDGVVGVVGAEVVLKGVDTVQAHAAYRTPVQVAEVDDQVGGDVATLGVDILTNSSRTRS